MPLALKSALTLELALALTLAAPKSALALTAAACAASGLARAFSRAASRVCSGVSCDPFLAAPPACCRGNSARRRGNERQGRYRRERRGRARVDGIKGVAPPDVLG